MGIQESPFNPPPSPPTSSPSPSPSPSPPPPSSSSSSLVSCSENYLLYNHKKAHCEGLDLLVRAARHIAGNDLFDDPFRQREVVRVGKTTLKLEEAVVSEIDKEETEEKKDMEIEVASKPQRQKRQLCLPSKFHDSVLQPWKRQTRLKKAE